MRLPRFPFHIGLPRPSDHSEPAAVPAHADADADAAQPAGGVATAQRAEPLPPPAANIVPGAANAWLLRGAAVVIVLETVAILQLVNHLKTYKQPPPVVPYVIGLKDPDKVVVTVQPAPLDVSTTVAIAQNETELWLTKRYKVTQDPQEMSAAWDRGGYLDHHAAPELFEALIPTLSSEWAAAQAGKTNRRVDITNIEPLTDTSYRALVTLTIEDARKPPGQAKLAVEKFAVRLDFDWRPQPLPTGVPVWKAPNPTGWTATAFVPTRVYE